MSEPLVERVQSELVAAMKRRDELSLSVLRMLKSAIQLAQVEKGRDAVLTDEEVVTLVQRLVKQRQEAAEQYRAGGAADRADRELEEARFLHGYLPEQLSDEELESLTRQVAQDTGAASPKDLGKVMGRVMPLVKGRAEGNRVRAAALKVLGS
ncbi:GatB/YqeY domain-containing protein [Aminomonas paucivorans]|uniref:GatB/YqeY domain-containing protein n=1 Tax=Aminomonas paucivorans TaxID=81412 RepID=UPI00331C9EC3